MSSPNDRRYARTHEWHRLDGQEVILGITKFAVDELTDVTYVEITADGPVKAGEAIGEIESVKATSDIYAGVDGEVVAVNQEVLDDPSLVNQDPYVRGWIVRLQVAEPSQLDALLDAEQYDQTTS